MPSKSAGTGLFDTDNEHSRRWNETLAPDYRTPHRSSDMTVRERLMPYYRQVGEIPRKRHTQFRRPDGGLYAEELMGQEGFSSDSSLLYHRGVPSAIVDARPWELPDQSLMPNA